MRHASYRLLKERQEIPVRIVWTARKYGQWEDTPHAPNWVWFRQGALLCCAECDDSSTRYGRDGEPYYLWSLAGVPKERNQDTLPVVPRYRICEEEVRHEEGLRIERGLASGTRRYRPALIGAIAMCLYLAEELQERVERQAAAKGSGD